MKVDIIGATGATGRVLLAQLLNDERFDEVHIFVRRAPDFAHDKLCVHLIDFSRPDTWADKLRGDVLFSCLGTTLKDAGSQEAQRKIDYQAVLDAARATIAAAVQAAGQPENIRRVLAPQDIRQLLAQQP